MKKLFLPILLISSLLNAQPVLMPHIGQYSVPNGSDLICSIPTYSGTMDTSGFAEGELVPDFTLFKINGDSVRLSEVLSNGKPVLLVGGNYTSPAFRQKITALNDMATFYAGQLQVYIIYEVEAHTIVDPSPYSGSIWITPENNAEGVLYEQPDNYSERLEMIDSLLANYTIIPEILVDGPCNEWWLNYGPAPNNAYLIDTMGIVRAKHGWFHKTPENMWCDIDSLLGTNSGNCTFVGNNGTFNFTLDTGDSTDYGMTEEILSIHGLLQNLSSTENAVITISKQFLDLPGDWTTAFCGDVCYSSGVNTATITLPPGDDLHFIFYFYTGTIPPDSGYAEVRFENVNVPGNVIVQNYYGITTGSTGITDQELSDVSIFPNPAQDHFAITTSSKMIGENYLIFDQLGKTVLSGEIISETMNIPIDKIHAGLYYLKIGDRNYNYKIIKIYE